MLVGVDQPLHVDVGGARRRSGDENACRKRSNGKRNVHPREPRDVRSLHVFLLVKTLAGRGSLPPRESALAAASSATVRLNATESSTRVSRIQADRKSTRLNSSHSSIS